LQGAGRKKRKKKKEKKEKKGKEKKISGLFSPLFADVVFPLSPKQLTNLRRPVSLSVARRT
jgi:hypothetical protein